MKFLVLFFITLLSTTFTWGQLDQPASKESNTKIFKNGLFGDVLIGGGITSQEIPYPHTIDFINPPKPNERGNLIAVNPTYSFSAKLGSKWYFGKKEKYKAGFQVIWARLGANLKALGFLNQNYIAFAPVNIGFTNAFSINTNLALEANFNVGFNTLTDLRLWGSSTSAEVNYGILFNPVIKLHIKNVVIGLDFAYTWVHSGFYYNQKEVSKINRYAMSSFLANISVGMKF